MRLLSATVLLLVLIGSSALCAAAPDSPFDQYGALRWKDEKARLDNFAIQLQQDEKLVGYILVYDATGGCPGEAVARAMRAKRYITEIRGIAWNRVMWRRDAYETEISTLLLMAPKQFVVPIPLRDSYVPEVDGPMTRACRAKLSRIRRDR